MNEGYRLKWIGEDSYLKAKVCYVGVSRHRRRRLRKWCQDDLYAYYREGWERTLVSILDTCPAGLFQGLATQQTQILCFVNTFERNNANKYSNFNHTLTRYSLLK